MRVEQGDADVTAVGSNHSGSMTRKHLLELSPNTKIQFLTLLWNKHHVMNINALLRLRWKNGFGAEPIIAA